MNLMTAVCWLMVSFRLLISCRTSWFVTRAVLCPTPANSGFERGVVVIPSPLRGLLLLRGRIEGSKRSSENDIVVPYVFVGGNSGAPARGSRHRSDVSSRSVHNHATISSITVCPSILRYFSILFLLVILYMCWMNSFDRNFWVRLLVVFKNLDKGLTYFRCLHCNKRVQGRTM